MKNNREILKNKPGIQLITERLFLFFNYSVQFKFINKIYLHKQLYTFNWIPTTLLLFPIIKLNKSMF